MRTVSLVVFLLSAVLISEVIAAGPGYTTKYDHLDVDAILRNDRLLNNYIKCLLDKGKCNDAGATLKKIVPDAVATGCSKCSEKQVVFMKKVLQYLHKNRRADWNALVDKYDPQGVYRKSYNADQLLGS